MRLARSICDAEGRVVAGTGTALDDPEVDFDNVAELIEVDQSLASQILRLANSAFCSARGTVSHVTQALVMLGTVVTRASSSPVGSSTYAASPCAASGSTRWGVRWQPAPL